ncbi:MAG TPA: HEAT repeat domain-containing protein, partial [Acidimicrobiia bacterium]|nr:HEAT repeat domain-containing protein [Acidimicrobiia bacterium]
RGPVTTKQDVTTKPGELSPETRRRLLADLDDPYRRDAAARALGRAREKSAVRPLIDLLRDDPKPVYIEALGRIGDEQALDYLLAIAPHYIAPGNRGSEDVAVLAEAIARLAEERALPTLLTLSRHPSEPVRAHAARGLATMHNPVALDRLRTLMQTDTVAPTAIEALGYLGTEDAVGVLAVELKVLSNQYFPDLARPPIPGRYVSLDPTKPQRIVRSLVATRRASALPPIMSRLEAWRALDLPAFQARGGHVRTIYTDLEAAWQLTGDDALARALPDPTIEERWTPGRRADEYARRLDVFLDWWTKHRAGVEAQAASHETLPRAADVKIVLYDDR